MRGSSVALDRKFMHPNPTATEKPAEATGAESNLFKGAYADRILFDRCQLHGIVGWPTIIN